MILDHPNCFGRVKIILVRFKIRLFWTNSYNLDLSKMTWTRPKQIGPVQNDCYLLDQNHFGPIEEQGISVTLSKNLPDWIYANATTFH